MSGQQSKISEGAVLLNSFLLSPLSGCVCPQMLLWWLFSAHFNGDTLVGYGVTHVQGAQSVCVWRFSQAFSLRPWFMQKSWLAKRVGAVEKAGREQKNERIAIAPVR